MTVRFFDPRSLSFGTCGITERRWAAYERYRKATFARASPQVRQLVAAYLHDAKVEAAVVDEVNRRVQVRYRSCWPDERTRVTFIEYRGARMSPRAKRVLEWALRTREDALVSEVEKTPGGHVHRVAFWQGRGKPALPMAVAFESVRIKTVVMKEGTAS